MLLRAGALSLALLLASRLLGVLRESAQAAAFGAGGLADVAVLVLTLPDWLAGVAASGALAYVLMPAWAGRPAAEVAGLQWRVATWLLAGGAVAALLLALARAPALATLAGGLPPALQPIASRGLVWSAVALPLALLSALWVTRLQHERDFAGMYGANLVVNVALIGSIVLAGAAPGFEAALRVLGTGLLAAMGLRLLWLRWRMPDPVAGVAVALPHGTVWAWAVLSAGLPLAMPFAARSVASQAGEGGLATFNYAWKLLELPLMLAIQLVASLAFPGIARALAGPADPAKARPAIRQAFALAWALGCAAVAALVVGAPALAQLLFGWGRMPPEALHAVASWAMAGSWGLLPQAVSAVALTVLAARKGLRPAVLAYAVALGLLFVAGVAGVHDGAWLMQVLNAGYLLVAGACILALGPQRGAWLPLGAMAWSLLAGGVVLGAAWLVRPQVQALAWPLGLLAAAIAATLVLALALWRSPELRWALRR